MVRIGVDLMGADTSPLLLFDGVLAAARQLAPSTSFIVYLTEKVRASIPQASLPPASIEFVVVRDVINMEDTPVASVRAKPGSSLVVGLQALAKKHIDAFVSSGNTGAFVAGAVLFLEKIPQVIRPGLIATLPSKKGPVVVIDVGGTAASRARHLIQFAHLGAAYHAVTYGTDRPTVGLLNIGIESKKGRDEVREAYRTLEATSGKTGGRWAFSGNVEGREIFSGDIDVVVTDGFTGNVLLKTAEGAASFVIDMIKGSLQGKSVEGALDVVCSHFCEEQQSGALLCGVEGVVIKVHGNASSQSLHQAIVKAFVALDTKVIPRMAELLL